MPKNRSELEQKSIAKERETRAHEWSTFRRRNLFTQAKLAETLGISRRTIQMIESARDNYPHPGTIRKFLTLKQNYGHRKIEDCIRFM
jgi:DNA-binding XRE family transcriptional regulator